jgi:hypothetical protein
VPRDISLNECRTLEDIIGGHYVHTVPPDDGSCYEDEPQYTAGDWKPNCPEAHRTIQNAISTVLRPTSCLKEQNRRELYVEIVAKLHQYLRRRYRGSGPHKITNKKFLQSPRRAGWLYLFALHWGRHWLAERIRTANGDERIKQVLTTGVIPSETFTGQQERQSGDNESLTFDRCQWNGNVGHAPDSMTILSDPSDGRTVEHASHGEMELVAAVRDEISQLSQDDQEFFYDYIDSRYECAHSAAQRKRFQRIRLKVKMVVTN